MYPKSDLMNDNIVCFAREAGGAEAIAPVVKRLQKLTNVHLYAKDYALKVFERQDLPCEVLPSIRTSSDLDVILKKNTPSFIFTSATSLPWNDMTERLFWMWGNINNVRSMAVIDQWQNYAIRFSGPNKNEHLAYLPDFICTLDPYARERMVEEGIPENRILVTGQPAFDNIILKKTEYSKNCADTIKKLGIPANSHHIIVFVSEAIYRDFHHDLGYTEVDALAGVLESLKRVSEATPHRRNCLIIKLHPQNFLEDFVSLDTQKYKDFFDIYWVGTELPPKDVVMIADLVIGMASILLVESILLDKPTISFQPNAIHDDSLIATKMGAIPLIRDQIALEKTMGRLLISIENRTEYIKTQSKMSSDGHAAERITGYIKQILETGSI